MSVKLNSRLRSSQALAPSLLAKWEVEVTLTQDLLRTGLEGSILSVLLLKKVWTEMKSSQVLPCECFRHPERGWLLLPALTPAGLTALLPQSKVCSNFLPPEPLDQHLTLSLCCLHPPKPDPNHTQLGLSEATTFHHLPALSVCPSCSCHGLEPFLPSKIIPNFHYSSPESCGDQSRPGCTFPQGRRAQDPVPFQAQSSSYRKAVFHRVESRQLPIKAYRKHFETLLLEHAGSSHSKSIPCRKKRLIAAT